MSNTLLIFLEWRNDEKDFKVVQKQPENTSIYLFIDESKGKIFFNIPKGTKLVTRRTVERRVKSIAKSGYSVPEKDLRIGRNFPVEKISEETEIPDVLLQVGHKYKADRTKRKTKKPTVAKEKTKLKKNPNKATKASLKNLSRSDQSETNIGIFLTLLLKDATSLTVQKQNGNYLVHLQDGIIEFGLDKKNNKITLLSSKRMSLDNPELLKAIERLESITRE